MKKSMSVHANTQIRKVLLYLTALRKSLLYINIKIPIAIAVKPLKRIKFLMFLL